MLHASWVPGILLVVLFIYAEIDLGFCKILALLSPTAVRTFFLNSNRHCLTSRSPLSQDPLPAPSRPDTYLAVTVGNRGTCDNTASTAVPSSGRYINTQNYFA